MQLRILLQFPSVFRAYFALLKAQKSLNENGLIGLERHMLCPSEAAPLLGGRFNSLMNQELFAVSLHEAVRLATRLPLWRGEHMPTCLPRSLALLNMLRRAGLNPVLRLGVSKRGELLASHAWVELNKKMIGEPESVATDFIPVNAKAWAQVSIDGAAILRSSSER